MAGLTLPNARAVGLTADEAVLAARVRAAGHCPQATDAERHLIGRFLAHTARFQQLMTEAVDAYGLIRVDTGGRSPADVVETVLDTLNAPIGR
ncbi:hypothetical protein [Streptomyces sp. TRM68367]|uniref:hypothetical protein n=1 Tax=Streptomyces sp. TRM68367 TaxID=2758415 RepID=UPI0029343098|nr:hypothetical protein [Streptomyces sp. TRM68367]